jgi:hypothetical protein
MSNALTITRIDREAESGAAAFRDDARIVTRSSQMSTMRPMSGGGPCQVSVFADFSVRSILEWSEWVFQQTICASRYRTALESSGQLHGDEEKPAMLAGERNQLLVGALGAAEDVDALSRKRFALRTRNARRWSLITKGYTQNIALHVGHCAPGYPSGLDPEGFHRRAAGHLCVAAT